MIVEFIRMIHHRHASEIRPPSNLVLDRGYIRTISLVGTRRQVADALLGDAHLGVTTFLIPGFNPLHDVVHFSLDLLAITKRLIAECGATAVAA